MKSMQDIQSGPADVALAIDRVGVKGLTRPLTVRDRAAGVQHTVAQVDLSVDLPAEFKGTHMSRFVEALETFAGALDHGSMKKLLQDIRKRLSARTAHAAFRFPYFRGQTSPASTAPGLMSYSCRVAGEIDEQGKVVFLLGVEVPVMTVCPCSLAISDQGAHSQRTEVRITARASGFLWLEDLIEIAEDAGSSPVYTLLKREDEKHVTETAFANPCFVEDVVRAAAARLSAHPQVRSFEVEAESYESIHAHSASASIKGQGQG
jgi:GTP cyclohydrolase I